MVQLHAQAVSQIKDELGITDLLTELRELQVRHQHDGTLIDDKERQIVARVAGHAAGDVSVSCYQHSDLNEFDSYPRELAEQVKAMRDVRLASLRANHPIGIAERLVEQFVEAMEVKITLACNHKAMQAVWDEITERFPQITNTSTERLHRRVLTDREPS